MPVVASPVGINVEFIRHGENGFLATSNEDWMSSLELLIKDPEMRKTFGVKGRKDLETKYRLNKYVEIYSAIIKKFLF